MLSSLALSGEAPSPSARGDRNRDASRLPAPNIDLRRPSNVSRRWRPIRHLEQPLAHDCVLRAEKSIFILNP